MKKVLFATTALVASTGYAAADIDMSAWAEIGIVGGDGGYAAGETQFHSDFQIDFSASGTTDNGLTFGFTAQIDDGGSTSVNGTAALDSETIWLSGDFGTLTMGDTDGAFDWAMQEVGIVSAIADDHTSHAGFNFNGGLDGAYDDQVLRYNNSFGAFSIAVSAEVDDKGTHDTGFGIGAKYSAEIGGGSLGIGVAYQSAETTATLTTSSAVHDMDLVGISLDLNLDNGFRVILNHSRGDVGSADSVTHSAIGLGYSTGNLSIAANYGRYDFGDDWATLGYLGEDASGFGIGINYALGGGATLMFGYGDSTLDPDGSSWGMTEADNDAERWSFGLGLSF